MFCFRKFRNFGTFPTYKLIFSNLSLAAIAWRKKQFKKYFVVEENFNKFHQLAARLLESPTEKIMRLVQESIAVWMLKVDEKRAHVWWRTYHMGDSG